MKENSAAASALKVKGHYILQSNAWQSIHPRNFYYAANCQMQGIIAKDTIVQHHTLFFFPKNPHLNKIKLTQAYPKTPIQTVFSVSFYNSLRVVDKKTAIPLIHWSLKKIITSNSQQLPYYKTTIYGSFGLLDNVNIANKFILREQYVMKNKSKTPQQALVSKRTRQDKRVQ